MAICSQCGKEFNLTTVRRICGGRYGAGIYDDYFPDGDMCEDCAEDVIGADYSTGEQLRELMGDNWWDD